MPELPEVELVAQSLDKLVKNRRIVAAELLRERLAPGVSPEKFAENLKNSLINSVARRGKHILFDLDNGISTANKISRNFRKNPLFSDTPFALSACRSGLRPRTGSVEKITRLKQGGRSFPEGEIVGANVDVGHLLRENRFSRFRSSRRNRK
jgi:hypothetical protein